MERGYELIKRIAGGGMGEVFVARRTGAGNFEKRVAVKLLLPHLASSDELVARFHEEARLAARMHHPNIVEIFDVGEADGRPFLAMQLVDGVTLGRLVREVTKQGSRLPLPIVRLIATGLCEALTYAHTLTDGRGRPLRVVHRDVTPGNLLLSRNGAVLLTDFGIAREHAGQMTEPGVVRGKAAYLAPEQVLHDAPVDERADLYSAALTLYEALTGVNPFKREAVKDSLMAVVRAQLEPVDALRSDVTAGMAKALHVALSRSPDRRFRTARELRDALVDGPVATAPQLGEFVVHHCPELLAPDAEEEARAGTRSLINVTPLPLELPDGPAAPEPRRELRPADPAGRRSAAEGRGGPESSRGDERSAVDSRRGTESRGPAEGRRAEPSREAEDTRRGTESRRPARPTAEGRRAESSREDEDSRRGTESRGPARPTAEGRRAESSREAEDSRRGTESRGPARPAAEGQSRPGATGAEVDSARRTPRRAARALSVLVVAVLLVVATSFALRPAREDAPRVQPAVAQPAVAQPAVAEPAVAEPAVAEPAVAEPAVVQPAVVQPVAETIVPVVVSGPATEPSEPSIGAPPRPVRARPKPGQAAPPDVRVGYLTADATPWAEVLLGGRVIERTPFARFPLPEGRHTLVFRGPNGVSQERVVSVSRGEVSVVKVEFQGY